MKERKKMASHARAERRHITTSPKKAFEGIKHMAEDAGRDPSALELIVRANVEISDAPIQKDRVDFTGSLEQIAEDLAGARKLGAAEIVIDAQFFPGIDSPGAMVSRMEQFCEIIRRL